MLKKFSFKKSFPDIAAICLLTLTLPLFFYKLGQSSLVSWDEAWYAEIARNILHSGNIFTLFWNGSPYYDHPPVGFWLIAVSELLFGYNEFGVRAASALTGFASLIVTYFLGKELFNRVVGFCSAFALSSSFWFLFRARSGNLDVFLTFFFLLTILTAVKAARDKRYLIPFTLSLSLLILTKTGIPLTIIPALIIIFWSSRYRLKDLLWPAIIFLLIIFSWLSAQLLSNMSFIQRYLAIGLPGVKTQTSYFDNFSLAKTYVHDGIGKWFWPGVLGVLGSLVLVQRKYLILPVFCISFFVPFIFSPKGHIWHLIPLHPFMILSFFAFSHRLMQIGTVVLTKLLFSGWLKRNPVLQLILSKTVSSGLISAGLIMFSLYVSGVQINSAWVQFINTSKYISDEQILSGEAGRQIGQFYIDDDFGPTAVWYSGKQVTQIRDDDLKRLFDKKGKFTGSGEFVLITKQYRLDEQGIATDSYKILKSDRDKILIKSNASNP